MKYGKVFKKVSDKNVFFELTEYDFNKSTYSDLIRAQKKEGFRQVLFNTELMLELIRGIAESDEFIVTDIKMSEVADEDIREDIKSILLDYRKNNSLLYKIIDELEWYSDKESIDVCELELVTREMNMFKIKSNGIISSSELEDLEKFFEKFISIHLLRYFYEE